MKKRRRAMNRGPQTRQRPAEGLELTALFSNAPPGTRTGPRFRFTQIGSTIPTAEMQRHLFFSPHQQLELETVGCCRTLVCFHTKSKQTADKGAEFHLREPERLSGTRSKRVLQQTQSGKK